MSCKGNYSTYAAQGRIELAPQSARPLDLGLQLRCDALTCVSFVAAGARMVALPVADLLGRQQAVSGRSVRIRRLRLGL